MITSYRLRIFLVLSLFISLILSANSAKAYYNLVKITRVVDCDTYKLQNGRKVRAIGIDCNESKRNKKLYKDTKQFGIDPERLLAQGQVAYYYVKDRLEGKTVIVDCKKKDWFFRDLCYVYLPQDSEIDDLNFNRELVRKGYARAYRKYSKEFVPEESLAKQEKLGMWADS